MSILMEMFGKDWASLLEPFLKSPKFSSIGRFISNQYETKPNNIVPVRGSNLMFKAFRDVLPKNVKVVILGQDPYMSDTSIFDGYAFSCSNLTKPQPSLRNIITQIESEYPENVVIDRCDLSYLVEQGVLLANTALSVEVKRPDSHTKIWEPFTEFWIKRLSESQDDIILVLWGAKAMNFEKYINNPSNIVLKTSHPSPLAAHKECRGFPPFLGSGIFKNINTELEARGKKEIIW